MALNIIWYLAYCLTFGQEPPYLKLESGRLEYDNNKKTRYTEGPPLRRQRTRKVAAKQIDYALEMVQNLKANMVPVIHFFYNEYVETTTIYAKEEEHRKRLKREITELNKSQHLAQQVAQAEQHAEQIAQIHLKIEESKQRSKEPVIYSKLCVAVLAELDQQLLHEFLIYEINRFETTSETTRQFNFTNYTILKLLQSNVVRLFKLYYPEWMREVYIHQMEEQLKARNYNKVVEVLLNVSTNLKYSSFQIDVDNAYKEDTSPIDLKRFRETKRNTQSLHYYVSSEPLDLRVTTANVFSELDTIVVFFTPSGAPYPYVFDVLQLPRLSYTELSLLSWARRLKELRNLIVQLSSNSFSESTSNSNILNHQIIQIDSITEEGVLYDIFPRGIHGNNNYYYLRTQGLGYGTLYIHVDAEARRTRAISSINHRHRRYTSADIEPIVIQYIPTLDVSLEDKPCSSSTTFGFPSSAPNAVESQEKASCLFLESANSLFGHLNDGSSPAIPAFMFTQSEE